MLGVVGGLGSVGFVKLLLGMRAWFRRLPKWTVGSNRRWADLLVGLMGWFMPEVLGVGYDYVERFWAATCRSRPSRFWWF